MKSIGPVTHVVAKRLDMSAYAKINAATSARPNMDAAYPADERRAVAMRLGFILSRTRA
jgi:hypothetical protein